MRHTAEEMLGSALAARLLDGSLPQGRLTAAELLDTELIRH